MPVADRIASLIQEVPHLLKAANLFADGKRLPRKELTALREVQKAHGYTPKQWAEGFAKWAGYEADDIGHSDVRAFAGVEGRPVKTVKTYGDTNVVAEDKLSGALKSGGGEYRAAQEVTEPTREKIVGYRGVVDKLGKNREFRRKLSSEVSATNVAERDRLRSELESLRDPNAVELTPAKHFGTKGKMRELKSALAEGKQFPSPEDIVSASSGETAELREFLTEKAASRGASMGSLAAMDEAGRYGLIRSELQNNPEASEAAKYLSEGDVLERLLGRKPKTYTPSNEVGRGRSVVNQGGASAVHGQARPPVYSDPGAARAPATEAAPSEIAATDPLAVFREKVSRPANRPLPGEAKDPTIFNTEEFRTYPRDYYLPEPNQSRPSTDELLQGLSRDVEGQQYLFDKAPFQEAEAVLPRTSAGPGVDTMSASIPADKMDLPVGATAARRRVRANTRMLREDPSVWVEREVPQQGLNAPEMAENARQLLQDVADGRIEPDAVNIDRLLQRLMPVR